MTINSDIIIFLGIDAPAGCRVYPRNDKPAYELEEQNNVRIFATWYFGARPISGLFRLTPAIEQTWQMAGPSTKLKRLLFANRP